ncbi:RmlD-like substrate binding domain-containing protein [Spinellus fusiger]|nr:RmlD-like substrate binding domain-containing protein [Spinellus fusiger]
MKVIVTGASGLLVVGTALTRAGDGLVKLDLTNKEELESFVAEHKPQAIVHCAAERRPDVAENDKQGTRELNVAVPKHLGAISNANGLVLIYMSTDYVFDGSSPPYQVTDTPNPLNFYGETKWDGEKAVQEAYSQAIVLRVPILYGETEYNGESAVNVLIDAIQKTSKVVEMDNVCNRYPTHVQDVARVIKDLLVKRIDSNEDISGIFHFSSQHVMTKYTMCEILSALLNTPMDHCQPQNSIPASAAVSRPKDAHLSNARLESIGIDTSYVQFAEWWKSYLSQ